MIEINEFEGDKSSQTLSEEDLHRLYNRLVEEFGDKIPNPIHEPIRFMYHVKLLRYYDSLRQQ